MLDDGVNARRGDRDVKVKDVAELLWDAVGETAETGEGDIVVLGKGASCLGTRPVAHLPGGR